jgi:hypothetical protein
MAPKISFQQQQVNRNMTDTDNTPSEPAAPPPAEHRGDAFGDALQIAQNVAARDDDATTFVELRKGQNTMARDPERGRAHIQDTVRAQLSIPEVRRELNEEAERFRAEQAPAREQPRHEEALRYEQPEQHQQHQGEDPAVEQARVNAEFRMRAEHLGVPDFAEKMATFEYVNLSAAAEQAILRSPAGPQIALRLADNFEAIDELNKCSPAQIDKWITRWEVETEMHQRAAAQQQDYAREAARQPRRQTQAPRPIAPPSGGAGPPVDLVALAKSEDASAYVKARREQMARERR